MSRTTSLEGQLEFKTPAIMDQLDKLKLIIFHALQTFRKAWVLQWIKKNVNEIGKTELLSFSRATRQDGQFWIQIHANISWTNIVE